MDSAGEIVATYDGHVSAIQFKTHDATDAQPEWVERKHTIKLGE